MPPSRVRRGSTRDDKTRNYSGHHEKREEAAMNPLSDAERQRSQESPNHDEVALTPEDVAGPEWGAWYRLSPQERWRETEKLWAIYLSLGGSLDPEPDTQSPFFDESAAGASLAHGRAGVRVLRRGGRSRDTDLGRVHLRIEREPLQILQMGNAFGTCLSVGDINAFSTIANACELNKRVIFARDGTGRIVARKLLAVNTDGALVGFYAYASGPTEAANTALRAIMGRYAREFASRCNLELADAGDVPTLFAEQWYNDGVVPWSDAEATPSIKNFHTRLTGKTR